MSNLKTAISPMVPILVAVLAVLGGVLIWIATPFGVGLSPDSSVYVAMAESVWKRHGFIIPFAQGHYMNVTHFPPLYPLALSVALPFHGSTLRWARVLECLLFGVNIALAAWSVRRIRPGGAWRGVLASAFVLSAVDLLSIHTMAWSEPLFLLFLITGFTCLACAIAEGRTSDFVIGSLAIGMMPLVRYAGLASLAAGALAILTATGFSGRRARGLLLFALLSLPGIGAWFLRNFWLASHVTDRRFDLHPSALLEQLPGGGKTIAAWIACRPDLTPDTVGAAVFGCLFAGFWFWKGRPAFRGGTPRQRAFALCVVWFAVCYLGLLLGTLIFFDASTPLDYRLFAPLELLGLIAFLSVFMRSGEDWGKNARMMFAAGIVAFLVLRANHVYAWWQDMQDDGQQYTSRAYRDSAILKRAARLPAEVMIYTTSPGPLYIYAGRSGVEIPLKYIRDTLQINASYELRMLTVRNEVQKGHAVVLYFAQDTEPVFPTIEDLRRDLAVPCNTDEDGTFCAAQSLM